MGKRSKYWPKKDPRIQGGAACVPGTRLPTYCLVGCYVAGDSVEAVADWFETPVAAVRQAIEYAREHPKEFPASHRLAS